METRQGYNAVGQLGKGGFVEKRKTTHSTYLRTGGLTPVT